MSISLDYVTERVCRYNRQPSDDLLYRIGDHANILEPGELYIINYERDGLLAPEQRYRILNWILCSGFQIESDLALLIFGRNQLSEWLEISRRAYPDFEFYLPFEYIEKSKTGWETGINFSCYWMPKPGAPVPDPEMDFSWRLSWDLGEMFWGNLPNNTKNDFEFTLSVYPNQRSFTKADWICEEGDHYTTPTDEEKDLMSVAEVLKNFT
jgi:hypothetical protein